MASWPWPRSIRQKSGCRCPSASVLYASEDISNLALVPGLATQIGLTPSELADITADEGFTALTDRTLEQLGLILGRNAWRASPSRPLATPPPSSSPSTFRPRCRRLCGTLSFGTGGISLFNTCKGQPRFVCG